MSTSQPNRYRGVTLRALAQDEQVRAPRRVRRQRELVVRIGAAVTAARALDDETALLAVTALSGDSESLDTLMLLATEPVAPAADEQHLLFLAVTKLEDHLRRNGVTDAQLDELHWTGRLAAAVQDTLDLERAEHEQLRQWQAERAPQLVAVCRELLALLDELADEPALQRLARAVVRLLLAQLHLAAVRVANLPPPWIAPPIRVLAGAVQQCAPPARAADVSRMGHVAAVAA